MDVWPSDEVMSKSKSPITLVIDSAGPVFYDSTGPEPCNGWTNTPVDPGDKRLGKRVDEYDSLPLALRLLQDPEGS